MQQHRLGQSGGGGAGLGTGMVLIPQIMNQQGQVQAQAPTAALVICPKCGAHVPATSKFCPECGTNLTPPSASNNEMPQMRSHQSQQAQSSAPNAEQQYA